MKKKANRRWATYMITLLLTLALIISLAYIITSKITIENENELAWISLLTSSIGAVLSAAVAGFLSYYIVKQQITQETDRRRKLDKEQLNYELRIRRIDDIANDYSLIKKDLIEETLKIYAPYLDLLENSAKTGKYNFNAYSYCSSLQSISERLIKFINTNSIILFWIKRTTDGSFNLNKLYKKLFSLGSNWEVFLSKNKIAHNKVDTIQIPIIIETFNKYLEFLNHIRNEAENLEKILYSEYYSEVFNDIENCTPALKDLSAINSTTKQQMLNSINDELSKY